MYITDFKIFTLSCIQNHLSGQSGIFVAGKQCYKDDLFGPYVIPKNNLVSEINTLA